MEERREDFAPAEPNQKLFIGGLAWAATDEDLNEAFAPFGNVVSASVVKYPDTGRSKGFGFVEYETVEEATKAKEGLDGKEIAGRPIKVDFARPPRKREE
ncbi:RNA-binding protein [Candidatus Berkelbacteria bacterium CG10_big_fil_rev_8_21_14_0_10_43_13]|uniref:RNA-binding protein n=1 Tax=Candidatus Berkelbacteria bacterium CG10_big_fil_rev_8_21_14_0_10_43_13 TaxID=1974514 RepID=A0A2H0W5J7_9BACT|nr:MAG: RNA-binding protein [Candidatus Berkelbacteria bacterium CG10_big_fil_rev_8_21_14_0_10_43_13]